MKYLITIFIALGLVLSSVIGIEYDCVGKEMFPTYFGSPFVFQEKSLGSSMEYYYSVSGLILNVAVWSISLTILRLLVLKLIEISSNNRFIKITYKVVVGFLIIFSVLGIMIAYVGIGYGFGKGSNYWYMDLDKEASDWGMECNGEWKIGKI